MNGHRVFSVDRIEAVARALARTRGFNPDMLIRRGVALRVLDQDVTTAEGDPFPIWAMFRELAVAALAGDPGELDEVRQ